MRPTWDKYFIDMCDLVSTRGTCDRKKVGAVLVKDKRVISTGYNGSLPGLPHCDDPEEYWECPVCKDRNIKQPTIPATGGKYILKCKDWSCSGIPIQHKGGHLMVEGHCVRTIHAERNAIAQAALTGQITKGSVLYCNTFPCWTCFQLIVSAGIQEIIYKDAYGEDNMQLVNKIAGDLSPPITIRQYKES